MERFEGIDLYQRLHHGSHGAKTEGEVRIGRDPESYLDVPETRPLKLPLYFERIQPSGPRVVPLRDLRVPAAEARPVRPAHAVVDVVEAPEKVIRVMVDVDQPARAQEAVGGVKDRLGIEEMVNQRIERDEIELVLPEGEETRGRRRDRE